MTDVSSEFPVATLSYSTELIGDLKLGNAWVFEQLIFGPQPKTQTLPNMILPISSDTQPKSVNY